MTNSAEPPTRLQAATEALDAFDRNPPFLNSDALSRRALLEQEVIDAQNQ